MKNGYVYHIWKDTQKVRIADNSDNNAMKNWMRSLFRRKDLTGSNQGLNALIDVTIGSNKKDFYTPGRFKQNNLKSPIYRYVLPVRPPYVVDFPARDVWFDYKGNQTSGN